MATKEEILKQIESLNDKQRSIDLEIRGEPRARPIGTSPRSPRSGTPSIRDRLGPRRSVAARDPRSSGIRVRRRDDRAPPARGVRITDIRAGVVVTHSPRHKTRKRRLMSSVVVSDPIDTDTKDTDVASGGESDKGEEKSTEDVSPLKKKVRTRDRRMFGNLMAHLGRARKDLKKNKTKVEIRRKVEVQVLRKQDEERKKLRSLEVQMHQKNKQELQQRKLDVLRQKDALRVKLMAFSWRAHHASLGGFLQTTTQPPLFFVPASHNDRTTSMLEARKEEVEAELKAKADEEAAIYEAEQKLAETKDDDDDDDDDKDDDDDDDKGDDEDDDKGDDEDDDKGDDEDDKDSDEEDSDEDDD